jgi:hypothetical protein
MRTATQLPVESGCWMAVTQSVEDDVVDAIKYSVLLIVSFDGCCTEWQPQPWLQREGQLLLQLQQKWQPRQPFQQDA